MTRILKHECAHCGAPVMIRHSYTVGLGDAEFKDTGVEVRGFAFSAPSWPHGVLDEKAVSYLCWACASERASLA